MVGECSIACYKNNELFELNFFIVNSNTQAILGLDSSIKLNLIKRIESIHISESLDYSTLINEYKDIFSGTGCINSTYHIDIDKNAKPVVHPTRRVALPLLNSLKETLEDLENQHIIQKVTGSSRWVNALVIVRKPDNKLRICLDPQDLNKVI